MALDDPQLRLKDPLKGGMPILLGQVHHGNCNGWIGKNGGQYSQTSATRWAPVITLALQMRFISRQDENYSVKLLAAMRNQFGGHAIKPAD